MSKAPMELRGVSHLALVCGDMARTVDFYENVVGLRLVKTMELPAGMGQHFFFDIGNGDHLAFFYFSGGRDGVEEVSHPATYATPSADGSMHHIAIEIAPEDVVACRDHLVANDIEFTFVAPCRGRPSGKSLDDIADDTYAASMYFKDPDGIVLEFCAWLPAWDRVSREHEPWTGRRSAVPASWMD